MFKKEKNEEIKQRLALAKEPLEVLPEVCFLFTFIDVWYLIKNCFLKSVIFRVFYVMHSKQAFIIHCLIGKSGSEL